MGGSPDKHIGYVDAHTHCNLLWFCQFCSQEGEVKRAIWLQLQSTKEYSLSCQAIIMSPGLVRTCSKP